MADEERPWTKHRDKRIAYSAGISAKKHGAEGSFTEEEWVALRGQYGNICLACGLDKDLTADHVISLIRGGSNYITNIQPLCKSCNSRKNGQVIDYRNGPSVLQVILDHLTGKHLYALALRAGVDETTHVQLRPGASAWSELDMLYQDNADQQEETHGIGALHQC